MTKNTPKVKQEKPVETLQDFFFPKEGRTIKAASLSEAKEILDSQLKKAAGDSAEV